MVPFFHLKIMDTTQNTSPVKDQTVCARVNEKQLLSTIKHLFKSNASFLGELMQNARRAGASLVSFDFDPEAKRLVVTDNGCGIEDFGKLIDLCTSGWNEDIQLTDNPFGMGFFSIFFACDHITVRSSGLTMTASHEDIVTKRLLKAVVDEKPVTKGVVLELHDLKPELMQPDQRWFNDDTEPLKGNYLYQKLRDFAKGFSIEVQFNGRPLPRPHAQANLRGIETPFGFIHMAHIHDEQATSRISKKLSNTALYLQGLPIQATGSVNHHNVVHLSSAMFTPQMPDRAYLRDADKALNEMQKAMQTMIGDFLAAKKKIMLPEDFVKRHWYHCQDYGVSHLLNDIPFAPASAFSCLAELTRNSRHRWYEHNNAYGVMRMSDITEGHVQIWRNAPDSIEGDDAWAVLQLLMHREGILRLNTHGLDPEHWLLKRTPSCSDFEVTVTPEGDTGERANYELDGFECDIQLVQAVQVKITSTVDVDFVREYRVDDDFVVMGNTPESEMNFYDYQVVVYAMTNGRYSDSPVKLFSTFQDGDDIYREELQNDAELDWLSIINAMRGKNLADNIDLGIDRMQISIADQQIGQMALVHASRTWNTHAERFNGPSLLVVDLEDQAVWDKFSAVLSLGQSQDGQALKAAFIKAIGGVGDLKDPPAIEV